MASELANGRWSLQSSDNFDEYLKTLGVGMLTRVAVTKLKPDQEIEIKDDVWTIKTLSTFRNTSSSFKLNETFDEHTPDGRDVKVMCTVEDNKLIRKEQGQIDTVTTREFSAGEFKMTLECKGVVCTRIYKKV